MRRNKTNIHIPLQKTVTCQCDRISSMLPVLSLPKEMIKVVEFAVIFCALISTVASHDSSVGPDAFLEKKRSTARGYYGYPVLPYAEPLTILAGLAFIAYIIQAFHAFYHQHHGLGGVLNNVLPGKSRNSFSEASNQGAILDLKD